MSKLVAVRLPDDMVERIGTTPMSEAIIAALRHFYDSAGRPAPNDKAMERDRKKRVPESKLKSASLDQCQSCGAFNGGHQRWCKR
jgi:hypothetical protein